MTATNPKDLLAEERERIARERVEKEIQLQAERTAEFFRARERERLCDLVPAI